MVRRLCFLYSSIFRQVPDSFAVICFDCRFVIAITMSAAILKLLTTTTVLVNAIGFVLGQPPFLIHESKQHLLIKLHYS
jgi:hypothetical protein